MKDIKSRSEAILEGNIWKVVLLIALPMAIQNLLQAVYSLLDTVFASELGQDVVAGISYISPVNNLVVALGTGLSVAATTLIAREIARKDYKSYRIYVANSLFLMAIISIFATIFGTLFTPQIISFFKVAPDKVIYASTYLWWFLLFSPITLLSGMFLSIKRADGNSKLIFVMAVLHLLIKLVLNWLFIYVFKLGIASLVFSTAIANSTALFYGIYDLFVIKNEFQISKKDFIVKKSILLPMVIIGFPVAVEKSLLQFGHLITHYYAESLDVMAAYGMSNKINNITLSLLSGVGMAVAPIISQNLAVGNEKRIKEAIIKTSLFNAFLGLFTSTVLFFTIPIFYRSIISNSELYSDISSGYKIVAFATFFWGIMQVMLGTFHGYGKTKYNLLFGLTRLYMIRIPVIWIVYKFTLYAKFSVWIGAATSNILGAVVSILIALVKLPKTTLVGEISENDKKYGD